MGRPLRRRPGAVWVPTPGEREGVFLPASVMRSLRKKREANGAPDDAEAVLKTYEPPQHVAVQRVAILDLSLG